jgi:putative SOS response-associated peptidase YedK
MCGRYSLQTPLADLAEIFDADLHAEEMGPRFNLAPTEDVAVLRPSEHGREITRLRWGLIPNWSRDPAALPLIINARSESLESKPAFRDLLAAYRCAVLADGFYEWRVEAGLKQPYYVRRRDGRPLAFAALWDRRGAVESCAIVTTEANQLLLPLHDRMPSILASGDSPWLDAGERDFDRLREILRPSSPDLLEAYPVDRRMNRVVNDDPDCVAPLGPAVRDVGGWDDRPSSEAEPDQLGLF